jgi:hypothetical protein
MAERLVDHVRGDARHGSYGSEGRQTGARVPGGNGGSLRGHTNESSTGPQAVSAA